MKFVILSKLIVPNSIWLSSTHESVAIGVYVYVEMMFCLNIIEKNNGIPKIRIQVLALTYKTKRGQVDFCVYAYIVALLSHRVINKKKYAPFHIQF